jgi:hypothetical protein
MDWPAQSIRNFSSRRLAEHSVSLMWGGFALVWFLLAIGVLHDGSGKDFSGSVVFPLFGSVFVLVGQYLIWGRFVYDWWKKKRTYYALTSRRALIVEEVFGRKTSSAILETMLSN